MTILTDEQQVALSVQFNTAKGNPATVDGIPVWASSDESIIQITNVAVDGMSATAVAQGPLGNAQVSVVADADLGNGTREITGVADIEVKAAEAVVAIVAAGAPETQP